MNKKTNLLLGLIVALLAIVGIFVLFSTAFGGDGDNSSVRGSVFYVMLGDSERGYASVGGLISAFALLIVGTVSAIIGGCFKGKLASLVIPLGQRRNRQPRYARHPDHPRNRPHLRDGLLLRPGRPRPLWRLQHLQGISDIKRKSAASTALFYCLIREPSARPWRRSWHPSS